LPPGQELELGCDLAIAVSSAWLTWQKDGGDDLAMKRRISVSRRVRLAVMALLLISPHSQVYTFVWALLR
jgi:hypothetical protein